MNGSLQVWKFPIEYNDKIEVEMPAGASLLHAAEQGGVPCIWALVDPSVDKEIRKFRLAGTGHPINIHVDKLVHVGTFLIRGGQLVFHLFEVVR
jgi:hypothetical protein